MFCDNCGSEVRDNSQFCNNCGNRISGGLGGVSAQATTATQDSKGGNSGNFFSSPGGITLIILLGLIVIAGLVVGIVFAVRGGDSSVDSITMGVWDEYENVLEDDGEELAQIKIDQNALASNQAALQDSLERLEDLEKDLAKSKGMSGDKPDVKTVQLADVLQEYSDYIKKMDELMGQIISAVAGNQLINQEVVNNLNNTLEDLQEIASGVRKMALAFIKDNEQLTSGDFDPEVLDAPKDIAAELEKSIASAQAAEKARLDAEKAAADQAAAELERQKREQEEAAQWVTCPLCGGVGTIEGGDGRYVCPFCGGGGSVTRAKANTYNPVDWMP